MDKVQKVYYDTRWDCVIEVQSHKRLGFDGTMHNVTYSRTHAVRGEYVANRPWLAGFIPEPNRYVLACSNKLHAYRACDCDD